MFPDFFMAVSQDLWSRSRITPISSHILFPLHRISTEAQFAGTCIGVFLLTVLVESVRRWGREWDRFIVKQAFLERRRAKAQRSQKVQSETIPTTPFSQVTPSNDAEAAIGGVQSQQTNGNGNRTQSPAAIREALFGKFPSRSQPTRALFRPTTLQQMVRSFVYAVQFAGAVSIPRLRPIFPVSKTDLRPSPPYVSSLSTS